MNFDRLAGVYDAQTDEIISSWSRLEAKKLVKTHQGHSNNLDAFTFKYSKPYYIILPENINVIAGFYFVKNENLVGIYGKNVTNLGYKVFQNCKNLEEVHFPNLWSASFSIFDGCDKLKEKYTDENGLFIIDDNWLVSIKDYTKEKLFVPENIKVISVDAFNTQTITTDGFEYNINCKEIVLPINLKACILYYSSIDKIILPIDFEIFDLTKSFPAQKLIYKGTPEKFDDLIKHIVFWDAQHITNEPYTLEELKDSNYSLKEIEFILDKKLTLDELLSLNYSMKEANNYFRQSEEGKDEL